MFTQVLVNGIIAGVQIALLAVGFSIVYTASRFFVFTFGSSFLCAAYAMLLVVRWTPRWIAALIAVLVGALLGGALERFLYRSIRNRTSSPLISMLASIGAYTALQNVVSMRFGDETRTFRTWITTEGHQFVGARISSVQIAIVLVASTALAATFVGLYATSLGRQLRAIANDELVARVVGVDVEAIVLFGTILGSCLAALAGILMSHDTDLVPTMGFQALLLGVVAAVIGGLNSAKGALVGGLFVGLVQHLGVWRLPTEWQDGILFVVLMLFLLFRPQGFFGVPLRKATV